MYRDFGKTGLKVSAIGMVCEYVWTADEKQIFDLVRAAVDAGINYFDVLSRRLNVVNSQLLTLQCKAETE